MKYIEPLDNNTQLVLIGDSVFDNENYASVSVEKLLIRQHTNTLRIAKDGATIKDIPAQIDSIPSHFKADNITLLISIGGNDILNKYIYHNSEYENFDEIFENYKKTINNIQYNKVLCNIYYPPFDEFKPYYNIIRKWNDNLQNYAQKNKLELLELDKIMTSPKEFSNFIEPSTYGGENIVDKILGLTRMGYESLARGGQD